MDYLMINFLKINKSGSYFTTIFLLRVSLSLYYIKFKFVLHDLPGTSLSEKEF